MRQNILLIILIAAVILMGFFIYQYFFESKPGDIEAPDGIQSELLSQYRQIKTLKPDLSIFADPFFKSLFSPLQTFGTGTSTKPTVIPGRANPFVPF